MSDYIKDTRLIKTIKVSITEGIFAQIFNSLSGPGSAFLTKFALMLNATPFQFGILSAIGQLSLVFQPLGAVITRRREKRKGIVLALLFSGRGIAILYGMIPFVFLGGNAVRAFLFLFCLSVSISAVADNGWLAWISDMIPLGMRGRFFSARSRASMIAAIVVGFAFSLFIDRFAEALPSGGPSGFFNHEHLPYGFAIVFCVAVAAGVAGLAVLSRQPEKIKPIEEAGFVAMFVEPMKDVNFRRFLLYGCWWMFAVGIAQPFWQFFMMKKLHMSLFEVQIYGNINIISAIAFIGIWGRLIDAYGNKTAMRLIILMGGFNPMVWLFVSPHNCHILYIEAITSGIMWGGAGLVGTNFVLSVAPEDRKQVYAGVSGAFSGVAMMTTMLISGAFLPRISEIKGLYIEPEQVLFALTGIARWSTQIPLSWVRERRSRPVNGK